MAFEHTVAHAGGISRSLCFGSPFAKNLWLIFMTLMEENILLGGRIQFFRVFSIILNIICCLQLVLAVVLPDSIPTFLKTWLISVAGGGVVGTGLALFLSKSDLTLTLFLIVLSTFLSGLVSGISALLIVKS